MRTAPLDRRRFLVRSAGVAAVAALPVRLFAHTPPGDAAEFLAAVRAGRIDEVRERLVARPALRDAHDAGGRTAFALAHLEGHDAIGALLIDAGYRPDVHEAALAGDWERFDERTAEAPGAVRADHPLGGTAMYAAALGGAGTDIWRVYAALGEPNAVPPAAVGASPLQVALRYRDLEVAELTAATLLANDADPNPPGGRDDPPLHLAAERGSGEIVEMLVRLGARLDARDRDGRTARERAVGPARDVLARADAIPRTHSSSRTAYDAQGRPYREPDLSDLPLVERRAVVGASHGNDDEVARRLGTDARFAHSVATTGERAVEAAAHMGRRDIAARLLDAGAPYSLPTAAMSGDRARVDTLLAEDPLRIHERGAHDFPLLWYPVIGGSETSLLARLIERGAVVEEQHHLGTTALHWAAIRGDVEKAELLLRHGADPNRAGRKFGGGRQTPLDIARARGRDDVAALLVERGAEG